MGNVKSLSFYSRLFLVHKPQQRWRSVIDLSRLSTFLLVGSKWNLRVNQGLSDSRSMGVIDKLVIFLPSHPHPPKLKKVPAALPQFTGVPVHLPPFWPSHGPAGLYNGCKGSETDGRHKGSPTSPMPSRMADQFPPQEEGQVNTQTVVDLTQSLGWIINQEKSKLKPTQVFLFVG